MNEVFNLLSNIPFSSKEEIFETINENENIRIERILSYGQETPSDYWYNQDEDEFIIIIKGEATLIYEDNRSFNLKKNDTLYIKAHQKHKVTYTSNPTIWLAIFIKNNSN